MDEDENAQEPITHSELPGMSCNFLWQNITSFFGIYKRALEMRLFKVRRLWWGVKIQKYFLLLQANMKDRLLVLRNSLWDWDGIHIYLCWSCFLLLQMSDSGTYLCKGVNGFGSAQAQIELLVSGDWITDCWKYSGNGVVFLSLHCVRMHQIVYPLAA